MLLHPSPRFDFGAQTVQQFFRATACEVRFRLYQFRLYILPSCGTRAICLHSLTGLRSISQSSEDEREKWKCLLRLVSRWKAKAEKLQSQQRAAQSQSKALPAYRLSVLSGPSTTFANARSSNRRVAPTIEGTAWLSVAKLEPSIEQEQLYSSCALSLKRETATF